MEEQIKLKMIIIFSIIALLFSTISIWVAFSAYGKAKSSQGAQSNSEVNFSERTEAPAQVGTSAQAAAGFVGLPDSDIQKNGSNMSFVLRGHWLSKDASETYTVGEDEKIKIAVVINADTKIIKFQAPIKKDEKIATQSISLGDFRIESKNSPYLITFSQPVSSSASEAVAKEVRILPTEIK